MRRRDIIGLLAGTMAWPFAACAQQRAQAPRIAMLIASYTEADKAGQVRITAFLTVLQTLGMNPHRDIRIDYHWGGGSIERVKAFAAQLVQDAPDAIIAVGDLALAQLHQMKSASPIVFTQVSEPVDSGFVASLARPGGNITGFQNFEPEMGGKWLGVLNETVPGLKRVGVLFGSDAIPHTSFLRAAEKIAPSLGVSVVIIDIGSDIEGPLAAFAQESDSGLIVFPHPRTIANRRLISSLAIRHGLPAIYPYRYFANDGGLVAYGPDQLDQWRGAAMYIQRILKGEKPANLPVQAPTRYELAINLRAARALGLTVPPSLLTRADEVIE
ncbi:MAG TPA: ABC transporter substrate-binding protein [Pseudolabrys sp.]|nr:ABC transporter substrate-binding protein [Pseudolabrys sp.]